MTNVIIGLCVGLASAVALVVMWRVAGTLRNDAQPGDEKITRD